MRITILAFIIFSTQATTAWGKRSCDKELLKVSEYFDSIDGKIESAQDKYKSASYKEQLILWAQFKDQQEKINYKNFKHLVQTECTEAIDFFEQRVSSYQSTIKDKLNYILDQLPDDLGQ